MKIKDILEIVSNEFVIHPTSRKLCELKNNLLPETNKYIIAMNQSDIVKIFNSCILYQEILKMELSDSSQIQNKTLADSNCNEKFSLVAEDSIILKLQDRFISDKAVVVNEKNYPIAVIDNFKTIKSLLNFVDSIYAETKETLFEYKKIFECIEEEIFVTDQNGVVLRVNPATERLMGVSANELIGKNVEELVKEQVYSPSITIKALKEKKKQDGIIEYLNTGKRVLVTVFPVFDDKGEIIRTVSTSKDVLEINKLRNKFEEINSELERKNAELSLLRDEVFTQVNFVSKSEEMQHIKETISKIAPMDLTVLIEGESGVGKEVVAKAIHYMSNRKNSPFIKINCSLIPENLFESELFGYESGAFTGANKQGKLGKIELTNGGTIFLDEIGEVPLSIQVKLLEFLQDREICRVGGTTKIKIETRVIAATNRDLQKMVKNNTFRQDLYYRLSVIPITIPPLRERPKDIPVIVQYFLKKVNNKYNMNKILTPEAIDMFLAYNWPGNVRELEHVVERLMVVNDSDLIIPKDLSEILEVKPLSKGKVICTDIIPLKLAKKELEEQLIKRAYETYKSTYKAAEVLEVDQSTVAKILKKYR